MESHRGHRLDPYAKWSVAGPWISSVKRAYIHRQHRKVEREGKRGRMHRTQKSQVAVGMGLAYLVANLASLNGQSRIGHERESRAYSPQGVLLFRKFKNDV